MAWQDDELTQGGTAGEDDAVDGADGEDADGEDEDEDADDDDDTMDDEE